MQLRAHPLAPHASTDSRQRSHTPWRQGDESAGRFSRRRWALRPTVAATLIAALALLASAVVLAPSAAAQAAGSITGTVRSGGSPVAGVDVCAGTATTGFVTCDRTDSLGGYLLEFDAGTEAFVRFVDSQNRYTPECYNQRRGDDCSSGLGLLFAVDAGSSFSGIDASLIARPTCLGQRATVDLRFGETPTNGPDVIVGTTGDDIIRAGAGNDLVCALGGNDKVFGGTGLDRLYGDSGADRLFGSSGNDFIDGGDGADRLYGGDNNDTLVGGFGADRLFGQDGEDRLNGQWDDDLMWGGNGADRLLGHDGDDELSGQGGNDKLFGQNGDDMIHGGNNDDLLVGGAGEDSLTGDAGVDNAIGGADGDICDAETETECDDRSFRETIIVNVGSVPASGLIVEVPVDPALATVSTCSSPTCNFDEPTVVAVGKINASGSTGNVVMATISGFGDTSGLGDPIIVDAVGTDGAAHPADAVPGLVSLCDSDDLWDFCLSDVDCNDVTDLADAVAIFQELVGLRDEVDNCSAHAAAPSLSVATYEYETGSFRGDADADGRIGPGDTTAIVNCRIGRTAFCNEPVELGPQLEVTRTDALGTPTTADGPETFSKEFSGLTYNADINRLVITDGRKNNRVNSVATVALNANGDPTGTATMFTNALNQPRNFEGITWMFDDVYAVVHEENEQTQLMSIIELSGTSVSILEGPLELTFDDREDGLRRNKGAEGISFVPGSASAGSFDGATFIVVKERTPRLAESYTLTGGALVQTASVTVQGVSDLSGVAVVPDVASPSVAAFITSEQTGTVLYFDDLFGSGGVADRTLTLPSALNAPEGITLTDHALWVVGENEDGTAATYARFRID